MKIALPLAVAATMLAGCASFGPLQNFDHPRGDPLNLSSTPDSTASTVLTADDRATLSLLHDRAYVGCLAYKNGLSTFFSISGVAFQDDNLLLAAVPAAIAAAKVASGPLTVVSAIVAATSPTLQKLVGLPQPATFATAAAGIDVMYRSDVLSPGIARGLNDPKTRASTMKLLRVGFEQVCRSTSAMPTTSVYTPAQTVASAAPVQ